MNREEREKNLFTLPWQALCDFAIKKGIDEDQIKGKEKNDIIKHLLSLNIGDDEIERLVDSYVYGDRVTFTLWSFSTPLQKKDYSRFESMEGYEEPFIDSKQFRKLRYTSVKDSLDRVEVIYNYSKAYNYTNEEGRSESVWELHRGCIWIGKEKNYVASISKHEKMMQIVIDLIGEKLSNRLYQIKPPKKAIERCTNYQAMSRIVLQGIAGEKTAISNPSGFTASQEEEVERIQSERFDTSGSYIATINDNTTATVKYNCNKGNIGVYKHLSSNDLFCWSSNAIQIILEEIENLRGRSAPDIFKELNVELKWPGQPTVKHSGLNDFLTSVISSINEDKEYRIQISDAMRSILDDDNLFIKIPRVFCNECGSYEIPYCKNCGNKLTFDRNGNLECSCNAPLSVICGEHHNALDIKAWFIPKDNLLSLINKNVKKIYNNRDLNYQMCVMDDVLCIVHDESNKDSSVEVYFSDVEYFNKNIVISDSTKKYAVKLNEKCNQGSCSTKLINECIKKSDMICLPKLFYKLIPGFRPQPHKGNEFGDVSGQIKVGNKYYQMIGIIKKNTENKSGKNARKRTDEEMINKTFLSTSKEGEEIIRQFVEQGMSDSRVQVIAVVAPQYFDHGLKGTLLYLARLANKKVMFIGLDEVCKLVAMQGGNISNELN